MKPPPRTHRVRAAEWRQKRSVWRTPSKSWAAKDFTPVSDVSDTMSPPQSTCLTRLTRLTPSEAVGGGCGAKRAVEPERPAQPIGAGRGTSHREPFLVNLVRLRCIYVDVAIAIRRPGFFECDALMPAVHAADGIRLDGKGEVLVNADLAPPDTRTVGVGRLKG